MEILFVFTVWGVILTAYWSPTLVALARKTGNVPQVAVMNFFGFTLVFWVVAMVFALKPERVDR